MVCFAGRLAGGGGPRQALTSKAASSTLVGMRSDVEVMANLRALEGGPDPEILAGVRAILAPVAEVEWPVGLPENNTTSSVRGHG